MSELFKRKPWLWIVILLALFVLLDIIFLVVAQRSTDAVPLEQPAPSSGAAPGQER